MNSNLLSGQAAMPLIKGICCLLSAERVTDLTSLLTKGLSHQEDETSPLAVMTALAIHIEQHRLDRTSLPIYQGRELLMAGAADLLGEDASFEDQDALRLLALLLDKLLRGGGGSRQAKLDGLTPSAMEQRGLAAKSPNSGAVVRGSWRRKSRNQLGHASWLWLKPLFGASGMVTIWQTAKYCSAYCWAGMTGCGWSMVCWPGLSICQSGPIEEAGHSCPRHRVSGYPAISTTG